MSTVRVSCPKCAAELAAADASAPAPRVCPQCGTELAPDSSAPVTPSSAVHSSDVPPGTPEPTTVYVPAGKKKKPATKYGPDAWQPGAVILHLYEVKEVFDSGGMGLVYRVRHRGWNIDLAVKAPRPRFFRDERGKVQFEREAETWIRLGLHPHIATCYYVRRLDQMPRIFAEFVEGGSLSEWIRSGRLYEGGPEQALARILDIAIQLAWGLHYAHEQGLVHQDVKPGNVLLTPGGLAKVTDFGLARAQSTRDDTPADDAAEPNEPAEPADRQRSVLVSTGGMTPAYCSPEQAQRQPLSRKTDIWSWGLTLLEMFTGEVTWQRGTDAAAALRRYREKPPADMPPMPVRVTRLLRQVFDDDPERRPRTMRTVVDVLQEVYQEATGKPYPRAEPEPAEALAASLNNRAISLLDLGKQEDAEKLWEQALEIEPQHPESSYNLGLSRWRAGRLTEEALVQQLRQVAASHPNEWSPLYLLGQVHLEREDCQAALAVVEAMAALDPRRPENETLRRRAEERLHHASTPVHEFKDYHRHTAAVTALALTSDGRYVLSGSQDWTLRLWHVRSGVGVRGFEGHEGPINAVTFSSDGRLALSGSGDHTVKVWDVVAGTCLQTLTGHEDQVTAVSLLSGKKYAVSSGWDGAIKVWDVATGRCLRTYGGGGKITALAQGARGRRLLAAREHATAAGPQACDLLLWDLTTGKGTRTLAGHSDRVTGLALTPDARLAVSGSWDRTVKIWDTESGTCLRTLAGHAGRVSGICLSSDGGLVFSASEDNTFCLWEIRTGKCLRVYSGTHRREVFAPNEITALAVSPDGRRGVTGCLDGTLQLWKLDPDRFAPGMVSRVQGSEKAQATSQTYRQALREARDALAEGDVVKAARRVRTARSLPGYGRKAEALEEWTGLYTRLPRKTLSAAWEGHGLQGHRARVTALALSRDGRRAVSASKDRTVRLWDGASGDCARAFKGHEGTVCTVALSADGRHVLSAGKDQVLRLWEVESGNCVQTFTGHEGAVRAVCLAADGQFALSGGWDRTLRLWEVSTGRCLRTYTSRMKEVTALCLGPDERFALSGGLDQALWLWDLAEGRPVRNFPRQGESVTAIALRGDGRQALSANRGRAFHLWDVAAGNLLRTFEGHGDQVNSVSLSPDGRHALSGSADRTARLWEVGTGRCLRKFEGHKEKVTAVILSADGRFALSGDEAGAIRQWLLDWDLELNSPADWDEGARPYLEAFLTLHTPYAAAVPRYWTTHRKISQALTREGMPNWEESDFEELMATLGRAGFGWLRPEGVRCELRRLAESWTEPPPLPGGE